jgi:hypothetical protein
MKTWRYLLTKMLIEPQSNKVQAIFVMQLPKGVKQPRAVSLLIILETA